MNIEIGKVVNVAGTDWIVLDKDEDSVLCLTKDLIYKNCIFDNNTNNYETSSIKKKLATFLKQITKAIGEDAVFSTVIDLTSDDGLDDYGYVIDKIGLLTADAYRKYNRVIEKHPVKNWWWLATPMSTPHRNWSTAVRIVYGDGTLDHGFCSYSDGVRPFCIFKSSIFES